MKTFSLFSFFLGFSTVLSAQVIHVPADYPTIQQGINAANPGDTVLVADGTYFEQINFLGKKPLMVASEFLMDGDTSHISQTIINGSQIPDPDSASVVYLTSGEDTTSVLCGFTITGGTGTTIITPPWAWNIARQGGGIWISGSGAKIINNHITQNKCDDVSLPPEVSTDNGGGIATDLDNDEDHWVVLEGNVIDSNLLNTDNSNGCCSGGGVMIIGNCRINNNIIKNNVSKSQVALSSWWSQGAGAMVFSIDTSYHKKAFIKGNQFISNINNSNKAFGGGMKIAWVHLNCSNNYFKGNQVISDVGHTQIWGGGLEAGEFLLGSRISGNTFEDNYSQGIYGGLMLFCRWDDVLEPVLVENNYFFNNTVEQYGGGLGSEAKAILVNNVFSGNTAGTEGGACYFISHFTQPSEFCHMLVMINNSFSNNKAMRGGALYAEQIVRPLIINSIFWGDSASEGREIFLNYGTDTLELAYSTVFPPFIHGNVLDGGGNMNDDPMYFDPVLLTLPPSSYCVDNGTSAFTCTCGNTYDCPLFDILGAPRPWGTSGVDMGAYEYTDYTGVSDFRYRISDIGLKISPNPCKSSVSFLYNVEKGSQVCLRVYDGCGRMVAEPVNAFQNKGEHRVEWIAGELPAGVYFCWLQAGNRFATGKLVKVD